VSKDVMNASGAQCAYTSEKDNIVILARVAGCPIKGLCVLDLVLSLAAENFIGPPVVSDST